MNTSTAITLNERFSVIKKQSSNTSIPEQRGRSRSRSRNRLQPQSQELRGSRRNQALLNKLEQQHKFRIALKLKNKSLMASRGRNATVNTRNKMRRAGVIKKAINTQRLRRSNSLTTFIPLNDAPSRLRQNRSRSRSRSRSRNRIQLHNNQNMGSVHDRLGVIRQPRRRMRRGGQININAVQRSRSRSRQRLNRNNFRNTGAKIQRSNSVNARLGNNGPQLQQQQLQNRRRRFRSRSRNNMKRNFNNNNNNNNGIVRNNRNAANRNQINRPLTGRIIKRRINRKTGVNTQRIRNAAARNIKKLQRGNNNNNNSNGQARGRARNRGQRNNQGGGQQQQQRRGRSRTRRANRGKPQISKEQLDKQLDEYMAKGSA